MPHSVLYPMACAWRVAGAEAESVFGSEFGRTMGYTAQHEYPVLQNVPFYAEAQSVFGSCFAEASFT